MTDNADNVVTHVTTYTRQQAFDHVVRFMAKQKQAARTHDVTGSCMYYQAWTKRMCAVGCLLSVEEASELEKVGQAVGGSIRSIAESAPVAVPDYIRNDLEFYAAMQHAHDTCYSTGNEFIKEFFRNMTRVAAKFDLNTVVIVEAMFDIIDGKV